jgi:hypothetical protein
VIYPELHNLLLAPELTSKWDFHLGTFLIPRPTSSFHFSRALQSINSKLSVKNKKFFHETYVGNPGSKILPSARLLTAFMLLFFEWSRAYNFSQTDHITFFPWSLLERAMTVVQSTGSRAKMVWVRTPTQPAYAWILHLGSRYDTKSSYFTRFLGGQSTCLYIQKA